MKLRATKMTRAGWLAFIVHGELGAVPHTPFLGSAQSSTKPLWTRMISHFALSTIVSKPCVYHSEVALIPIMRLQVKLFATAGASPGPVLGGGMVAAGGGAPLGGGGG